MVQINPVVERDVFDAAEIRALLSGGQVGCVIVRETMTSEILGVLTSGYQHFLSRHWAAAGADGLEFFAFQSIQIASPRGPSEKIILKDAFASLALQDIARTSQISNDKNPVMGRFHLNHNLRTGAHIDRFAWMNISHRHLVGPGMVIFCPNMPMDIRSANKAGDQFDRTIIDKMVRQRCAKLRQLRPGEVAYFNQTCLHWSAIPLNTELSEVPKFRSIYA